MKYKKIGSFKSNKVNPFIEETMLHVEREDKLIYMGGGDDMVVDTKTGELVGTRIMGKRIKVDAAQFRKIYISNLAQWFDLSKPAIRVMSYILSILKPNKDQFIFDIDECMEFTKYKGKNSVLTGLSELLENRFIARGKNPYIYFVNPTVIFNGDRLVLVKEYQIESKEIPKKMVSQAT